ILLGVNRCTTEYLKIANDQSHRQKFIEDATDFVVHYNFDGLNLNWDHSKIWFIASNIQNSSMEDKLLNKQRIALLLHELKVNFLPLHRFLSASFTGTKEELFEAHDFTAITEYVDFLSFTPNNNGASTDENGVNPMETLKISNIDDIINSLIKMGVSQSRIVMQVSFFGALLTPRPNGIPTIEPIGYNEICAEFEDLSHQKSAWNINFDPKNSLTVANHMQDGRSIIFVRLL
ncbi:probable chitinase 2, partial [Sitodiplosis mosellana]|uniref:probable chitinase 2 n=1 Tax=Sitodiplosis mosellana TaxID=263140 RepID=UPI00244509C0